MRDILYHLPFNQGLALRAAARVFDPLDDSALRNGYIAQAVKQRMKDEL